MVPGGPRILARDPCDACVRRVAAVDLRVPADTARYPRVVRLARRAPWYAMPLGIFLLTRLVDVALIAFVARDQIPASALPPHLPMPTLVDPASYLPVIANCDGQ